MGWTGIVLFLLCEARTRMLLAAVKRKVAAPERSSGEGAQGGHLPDEAVANCLRELTSRQNQLVVRLDALSRELTRARTVLINELPQWRSAIEQPISSRLLETDTRLSGKLDAGLEVMSQAQAKEVKERRGAVAQLESALGSTQHRLATEAAARAELTARVSEQSRTLIAVGKSVEGIGGRLDRGLAQLEGLSRTVGQAAQIAEERAERLVTAERSLDRLSISMEEETGRLRRLQSDVSAISALLDAERRRLGELTELQSRISERADENAALLSALSTAVDGYSAGASAVREALDLFRADAAADREKLIALDAAHAVLKSTQTRSTDELKMAMEARVAEIAALRDTVEALGVGAVADRQQLAALDSAQAALESIQTTSTDELKVAIEARIAETAAVRAALESLAAGTIADRQHLAALDNAQAALENTQTTSTDELKMAMEARVAEIAALRDTVETLAAGTVADRQRLAALDNAQAALENTQTTSTDELKMAMEARVAEIAALRDTVETLAAGTVADRQRLAALDNAQAALENTQTRSTDELKIAMEARVAEIAALRDTVETLAAGTVADRQRLAALDDAQAALESTQTRSTDELKVAMEARVAEASALRETVETLVAGTVADRQRLAALDDAQAALESTQTKSTDELKVAMAARVAEIAGLRASLGSLAAETVADRQRLAGLENAQAALESTQTKSADEFKVATEARAAEIVPLRETVETLAARTAADRQRLAALDSAQAALKSTHTKSADELRVAMEARAAEIAALRASLESQATEAVADRQRLAGLDNAQAALESTHTKSADELRVAMEARAAEIAALRASLESQATDAVADRQRLAGLENAQAVLESTQTRSTDALKVAMGVRARETVAVREMVEGLTTLVDADRQKFSALPAKLDQLSNSLAALRLQSVSLDLVSALRSVRLIWTQKSALKSMEEEIGVEHGHALLMAVLAEEERKSPGVLSGKTLIEIGTTRELWPNQGSTEKLAIFTAMTDMYFRTVDMDPANTRRAKEVIKYINPTARAITMKGEEYLSVYDSVIDYVYLDAFDCYHDNHSQQRKDRYRELLNTSITDETCWRMHADCAESLIEKMRIGGIIVIDDTWIDAEGTYTGKGKLAVPILEKSGFKIIAKIGTAIALRRPRKPNSQLK